MRAAPAALAYSAGCAKPRRILCSPVLVRDACRAGCPSTRAHTRAEFPTSHRLTVIPALTDRPRAEPPPSRHPNAAGAFRFLRVWRRHSSWSYGPLVVVIPRSALSVMIRVACDAGQYRAGQRRPSPSCCLPSRRTGSSRRVRRIRFRSTGYEIDHLVRSVPDRPRPAADSPGGIFTPPFEPRPYRGRASGELLGNPDRN